SRRRGGAEVRKTDEHVVPVQPLAPALRDSRLDANARRVTEDRLAVALRLLPEELETRHRDDGGGNALARQRLGGGHGKPHFGAGRQQRNVPLAVRLPQYVRAFGRKVLVPVRRAEVRHGLTGQRKNARRITRPDGDLPALRRLDAVGGTHHVEVRYRPE